MTLHIKKFCNNKLIIIMKSKQIDQSIKFSNIINIYDYDLHMVKIKIFAFKFLVCVIH